MTTQREALLDKIRNLFAKTVENGCTEAEALAALAKARAMMDVYAVGDDELALTKEEKAIHDRRARQGRGWAMKGQDVRHRHLHRDDRFVGTFDNVKRAADSLFEAVS